MEGLEKELQDLSVKLGEKTAADLKIKLDALEQKFAFSFDEKIREVNKVAYDELNAKFIADIKAVQDHTDKLDVKLQEKVASTENVDLLTKAINDNIKDISEVKSGRAFQTKTVANMTTSNLTGTKPRKCVIT